MSGFFSSRRILAGVLCLAVGATATGIFGAGAPATATGPATAAATAPAPAVVLDPNAPIAIIAGVPLNNQAFYNILMQVAGMRVFQEVFDLVLVQHAMKLGGVPFEGPAFDELVKKEYEKTIDSVQDPTDPKKKLTREQKAAILDAALSRQQMTQVELDIKMRTNAGLRAMAAGKNETTLKEARQAYDAEFGPARRVHLYVVQDANQASQVRNALEKEGKKPEDVSRDMKVPMQDLTIAEVVDIGKPLHDVIFTTLTRQKELSPIVEVPGAQGQKAQQVLVQLDEIVSDRRATNSYDEKEYTDRVKAFKEQQWMNNHLQTLRGDPAVLSQTEIKDPYLKAQFDALADQIKKQYEAATRAATQPSDGPATVTPASAPTSTPPATAPGRGGR